MADHTCQHRHDNKGWSAYLADWGFPTLHLLGTAVITISLLAVVDNRIFAISHDDFLNVNSQGKEFSSLTQPAMTSIISLALVLQRLAGGAWLTLTGWRMAFTVLEVDGASLGDIGRMINYRCPPFRSPSKPRQPSLLPTLWVIFLLATPSLFTSPLLTGAVNWIPTELYQQSNTTLKIPQPGPSNSWNEHNLYSNNRVYEVFNAVGLASTADLRDFNLSIPATYKRYLPWFPALPPNSTVANITIPVFRMNHFQQIRNRTEIKEDFAIVDGVISDIANTNQNYSTPTNLFSSGTDPGRLTMIHTRPWQASESIGVAHDIFPGNNGNNYSETMYEYPAATTVTERKLVIVAMQFDQSCTPQFSNKFGSFQDYYAYESAANGIGNHLHEKGCYIFFDLNYTAGITQCRDCQVQSNGLTPGGLVAIDDASAQILPHPLVETALAMMTDVLFYTEIANSSFAPTFNNLEGYARGILSNAYQASWNALARSFLNDSFAETTYQRPVPGLIAQLSKGRVIAWCVLNALFALSAVLLYIVRRECRFKAVVRPWLCALFLDTTAVVGRDFTGLCGTRKLDEEDEAMHVKLVCRGDGTGQGLYEHPVMVKEDLSCGKPYWQRFPQLFSVLGKLAPN